MIGWVAGRVIASGVDRLVVDTGGVGYEVLVPTSTLAAAAARPDDPVALWVHTHVAEGRFELYGFDDAETRDAFRILIGISGIGPRSALAVHSVMSLDELRTAIALEDARSLQRVPGIGKKTAARIIIELAEKGIAAPTAARASKKDKADAPGRALRNDALMALKSLGFQARQAIEAIEAVLGEAGAPEDVQELITAALKRLTSR